MQHIFPSHLIDYGLANRHILCMFGVVKKCGAPLRIKIKMHHSICTILVLYVLYDICDVMEYIIEYITQRINLRDTI